MTRKLAWLVGLLAVVPVTTASECENEDIALYRTTGAPPARTALIEEDEEADISPRITLSRGVVLAARCWDTCDYTCEDASLAVGDPSVLTVRALDRLGGDRPEHALIAGRVGATTLTVSTDCARKTYDVVVVDD